MARARARQAPPALPTPRTRRGLVQYGQQRDGDWYWRLRASNGKVLCHSEGLRSKRACLNGIQAALRLLAQQNLLIQLLPPPPVV